MLMFVPFSFRASEIIFSLSLKLANLTTIVCYSFLYYLLYALFLLKYFLIVAFLQINSVRFLLFAPPLIFHFSYYINPQIITTRSVFEISQSLTKLVVVFPKFVNVFLCFCFYLLRLSSTF